MPAELIAELSAHEVRTVAQMRWKGVANGALLALAAEQFDVMISMDQNMPAQQDLSRYDIGLVLVRAHSNRKRQRVRAPSSRTGIIGTRPLGRAAEF